MIGDLTSAPEPIQIKLFSQDPKLLEAWAPKVADAIQKINGVVDILNGIDNTISGPAVTFQVDPERRRPGRLHRGRNRGRCVRHPGGRTGADAGRDERSRLHLARALPGGEPRLAGGDARHAADQQHRAHGHAWVRWPRSARLRAKPKSGGRICSATWP